MSRYPNLLIISLLFFLIITSLFLLATNSITTLAYYNNYFLLVRYGRIRKHFVPRAHDISFVVVQQASQFLFTLVVILPQWSTIHTDYSVNKFLYVFFAGISTLIAEFLYLAATRHLSSTAAMACQHLPGEWLFIAPVGKDQFDKASRWVKATGDKDFLVTVEEI